MIEIEYILYYLCVVSDNKSIPHEQLMLLNIRDLHQEETDIQ